MDHARRGDDELGALHALADALGVQPRFVDGLGRHHTTPPEALAAVLAARGAELDGVAGAPQALRELARRPPPVVPPVLVAWQEQPLRVELALRPDVRRARCTIVADSTRAADALAGQGTPQSWSTAADGRVVLEIPADELPPPGRYQLVVDTWPASPEATAWLLVAPGRTLPGILGRTPRPWGVFLPLGAAWSMRSWGVGDTGDLARLASWAHVAGASVVGTLPLLACWDDPPVDPSPYAPVSRRFWNELHLDIDRIPAELWTPAARALADELSPRLRARADELVDHSAVLAAKHQVLDALVGELPPAAASRFAAFVERRPAVERYASFRAAVAVAGRDRRTWSPELKAGHLPDDPRVELHRRRHLLAQWLADEQLASVAAGLRSRGQELYLDLPLGAHPDGFDRFDAPADHVDGIRLGAPPDALFTHGQDWGLPPLSPDSGATDGHGVFTDVVDHHLRHAGVLRIDHVMGLHRQYWIPDGADATAGAYVHFPADQLCAVLSAASHRHGAAIVGENLGTVPPEVDELLTRHGIAGMHVAEFMVGDDPRRPLRRPLPGAVASVATHDLPPFAAWWTEADLDERAELGLCHPELDDQLRAERGSARHILATAATAATSGTDDTAATSGTDDAAGVLPQRVLSDVVARLGASDASLVLIDVEDLWGETSATNVPGTTDERPNWRRRAAHPVDGLDEIPEVAALAATVDRARRLGGSEPLDIGWLGDQDLHLFNEGRHHRLHHRLGAHPLVHEGVPGTHFAVWAPNARRVAVVGEFNSWEETRHPLSPVGSSGLWAGWIAGAGHGDRYRYRIWSSHGDYRVDKVDPVGFAAAVSPARDSIVWQSDHRWGDDEWMATRHERQGHGRPQSVYELHLGSWRRVPDEGDRPLTYRELAPLLADHCDELGFTHVELMPVMDHPFYGSWGYQITGYFAPSGLYGTPDDLRAMIDHLHRRGIGVILDWVPSHFPADEHGLGYFDGTHLYEHADWRQRVHPEWSSLQFNYGRHEVRSFLVSNAVYWLEEFHADGLRVDAVASMLYLDYGRSDGQWVPNPQGGRENLDAVQFLQELNTVVHAVCPGVVTMAEESTAWPSVTRPVHHGGLGFDFKWDMGWMHDTLGYLARDPVHRGWHHRELTFRSLYQFAENYVLALSHDEVVHGKGSLLAKMPGDEWQRFANLRLLYGYQWTVPGVPLLFMGQEWGPYEEWHHERSLPWHLVEHHPHQSLSRWVAECNRLLRDHPALWERDSSPTGFCWVDADDADRSVVSWLRFGADGRDPLLVVMNATPVPRPDVVAGVPHGGRWRLVANSDDVDFHGSGHPVEHDPHTTGHGTHGQADSLRLTLPPLAVLVFCPA